MDDTIELDFEFIPVAANIIPGCIEYVMQARVTDRDLLKMCGSSGMIYKRKFRIICE